MRRLFAFLLVFALGFSASTEAPNPLPALDRALRQFSALVQRSLPSLRAAEPGPIDAKAAARLDEDLDWSTAKTKDGLRAFLAKHPDGAHALEARAKLDGLVPAPAPPPAPKFSPVVEVATAQPEAPDYFAALGREMSEPKVEVQTVTRWREPRQVIVTRWYRERPRYHYRRPSPWPFLAWFGPRAPGQWR